MKFHPDVLAAHAEFGGDLEDMQLRYNANKRPVGRPPTGFDKKAYDAKRMREIRAGTWVKRRSSLPQPIPLDTKPVGEKT